MLVPSVETPKKIPAFFNPRGKLVREVSIVCYKAYAKLIGKSELTFADSMAGVGARGLRIAAEIEDFSKVFLNDTNAAALSFAKKSCTINGLQEKCFFSVKEACTFLLSREQNAGERFDVVDVDPFGTPAPFIDCAIRATRHRGLISLSATDSAVLCGVHPDVAIMKYQGRSLRTDYCHEIGIRLLFGALAFSAMKLEIGIEPLFSHHDQHYFRVYSKVKVGNKYARETYSQIGYVLHCFKCGARGIVQFKNTSKEGYESADLACIRCGNKSVSLGGPCWAGKIQSAEFASTCAMFSELTVFSPEPDIPLYYDLDYLSQKLKIRTPPIGKVLEELCASGFKAGRTRLNPKAVRTDAPLEHLEKIVARLAR